MYRDAPMATLTKNDGIISLQHCQEWSFLDFLLELVPTLIYFSLHNKNFKKSINVSRRSNVLHIHLNSLDSIVSFIPAPTEDWPTRAESRPERRKRIILFHFPKWVYALNKIDRNDASGSQSANTLIVTGMFKIICSWEIIATSVTQVKKYF